MSGFPWTSLITAVVPAAAVLAGAALTGRQNNQAGGPLRSRLTMPASCRP